MSASTKTGPSRIPTFGNRLLQLDAKPAPAVPDHQPTIEVTAKHIGNRVRVGGKEGILKFVGAVHFAKGPWCGIELNDNVGKNDGFVNGIRYFACPERRGLMAPVAKVSLINGSRDTSTDHASGPYSMLFIDPSKEIERSCSQEEIVIKKKDNTQINDITKKLHQNLRDTFSNLTHITNENVRSIKQTLDKKRSNDIELIDKESSIKTPEIDISNYFPIDKSCENLLKDSTLEVKRRRTSNPKIQKLDGQVLRSLSENIEKPTTLPQLKFLSNSHTSLGKLNLITSRISNIKPEENRVSNIKQEAINTNDEDNSKRDSLELDESLGILTPSEMCTQLLNCQTSFEYDKGFPSQVLRSLSENIEKPTTLPQLKFLSNSHTSLGKLNLITSRISNIKPEENRVSNIKQEAINTNDEDNSKRDSLELDESLGILTPSEMCTQFLNCQTSFKYDKGFPDYLSSTKKLEIDSPKEDSLELIDETLLNLAMNKNKPQKEELQSPNLTDYSLGIIDENILSNLTMKTDTTVNMELPLDVEKIALTRMDQTPSPEELPLDPTPVVECDPKTEPSKSKTSNSFINSVTSITSLDTGYQGDGEMSRPASRGADNSPLTRRPLARPQSRRIDPMTDSDFYTESDADNHEENPLRGDRKAQVIDGTLYGVDPQAAADIYVNNRENMDSSGIFTDIESNTRNEDTVPDVSPSDTSSKTISENSQNNVQQIIEKSIEKKPEDVQKDNPKKRNAPSPGISSPSFSSPRHGAKDDNSNSAKKYKMPKREVPSKVKAMLEPSGDKSGDQKLVKKSVGRWDAVMSKISKNEQNKPNLKEVKSKVFNSVNVNTGLPQRKVVGNQKNPNSKFIASSSAITSPKDVPRNSKNCSLSPIRTNKLSTSVSGSSVFRRLPEQPKGSVSSIINSALIRSSSATTVFQDSRKLILRTQLPQRSGKVSSLQSTPERRRIRNRPNSGPSPKTIAGSSIHSSLSDLSAATLPPTNKKIGSAKKRADIVQVTQVLTANKLSPSSQQQTAAENKKNATLHSSPTSNPKTRRTILPAKEKKPTIIECTRGTVKGGRTSPTVRPPPPVRVPVKQPPVAEALAVLVQHLVFSVQAYQVPTLKRQVEKFRIECEAVKQACNQLEEALAQEKNNRARDVEEQKLHCLQLVEKHINEISDINQHYGGLEQRYLSEKENIHQNLSKQHEEQLSALKKEFQESLDILQEENESIREQIDEQNAELEKTRYESKKIKEDYETKETILKEQNQKLKQQLNKLEQNFEDRLKGLVDENKRFREENDRLLSYGDEKGISIQEVQSLRAVLELKQNEVAELRRSLAEATHKAEILIAAEEKARALNARCEDLQLQLERKADVELSLKQENTKLHESFKEETNQKKRLSQYNEELLWKLKQNKEVMNKVLEQAEEKVFNRKTMSSSFNERHNSTRLNLERAMSFRLPRYLNRSISAAEDKGRKSIASDFDTSDELSPPTSPKVKGIVEKSDSVSYVLEMDESIDEVASRIFSKSFGHTSTPMRNAPLKSNSNKRPRIRNPLSQSSSSSAILNVHKNDYERPRSSSSSNDSVFTCSNVTNQDDNHKSSNTIVKLEDEEEDDTLEDMHLPALPSELDRRNGAQALPCPKHLAGEAMLSESNSEDESTSSSQL